MLSSKNGRGTALRTVVDCPTYESQDKFTVPYVDVSVIDNADARELTVFAVNRSLDEDMELCLTLGGYENAEIISHTELYSDDLKCENSAEAQNVKPCEREISAIPSEKQTLSLKKHSWNMIKLRY